MTDCSFGTMVGDGLFELLKMINEKFTPITGKNHSITLNTETGQLMFLIWFIRKDGKVSAQTFSIEAHDLHKTTAEVLDELAKYLEGL